MDGHCAEQDDEKALLFIQKSRKKGFISNHILELLGWLRIEKVGEFRIFRTADRAPQLCLKDLPTWTTNFLKFEIDILEKVVSGKGVSGK
jgi:hypothetical protein